ncbi:MAG TPA: YncE family protein [Candidatus Acidoferrales bacterium]|nr:YncE family protein [Candidatus Acidoferrales bacterium]
MFKAKTRWTLPYRLALVLSLVTACAPTDSPRPARTAAAPDYEIWALDQGTNQLYIYDSSLKQAARIDLAAKGARTAHMIDFTRDGRYAFIASTGSGDVTVIRTSDRAIVAQVATGPGTHMATVSPDGRSAIAAVIGDQKKPGTGTLAEIRIETAKNSFTLGRSLKISEDPLVKKMGARFKDTRPICQEFTADGRYAYVTLGPALESGGVLVLDAQSFTIVKAYPPDEVRANCGTVRTRDGSHMLVNGGSGDAGLWYVFDAKTHSLVHRGESRGRDAHGVWPTPDGREIWMVNRVSSNGIIIDPKTFAIVGELNSVGKTPDIIAMSPDSRYAFITLRGPKPVTAPHLAVGETPGFAVVDIRARKLMQVIQPAKGEEKSDFHGIGVRVIAR